MLIARLTDIPIGDQSCPFTVATLGEFEKMPTIARFYSFKTRGAAWKLIVEKMKTRGHGLASARAER